MLAKQSHCNGIEFAGSILPAKEINALTTPRHLLLSSPLSTSWYSGGSRKVLTSIFSGSENHLKPSWDIKAVQILTPASHARQSGLHTVMEPGTRAPAGECVRLVSSIPSAKHQQMQVLGALCEWLCQQPTVSPRMLRAALSACSKPGMKSLPPGSFTGW